MTGRFILAGVVLCFGIVLCLVLGKPTAVDDSTSIKQDLAGELEIQKLKDIRLEELPIEE